MRKIFLGIVVVFFVMMTASAYGFNPAHVKQLKETKDCPKCALSNADLTGANLSNAIWTDGKRCAKGSIGVCK